MKVRPTGPKLLIRLKEALLTPVLVVQVRSYLTLWQRPGTSFSVMFYRCCRPSSIQFRCVTARLECFLFVPLSMIVHLKVLKETDLFPNPHWTITSLNWSDCPVLNGGDCRTAFCLSVQGKEPSVRQLALLHFRNTIVLSVKLDDALSRPRARVPPSVTQMLLILQVGPTQPLVEKRTLILLF